MRQALVGLPVQGEETRSRHAHDTQVQVVVSASKGTELRQTGLGGCFVYGGLRRPPRVGRGHMRASERQEREPGGALGAVSQAAGAAKAPR